MSVLTVFSSSGDGWVRRATSDETFAINRAASEGNLLDYTSTTTQAQITKSGTDNFDISRCFLPFDTSSLPDDATIDSATLSIYVTVKNDADIVSLVLVQTTQASTSSLVLDDFDQCGTLNSPTEGAARITVSGLTLNAYNDFTLNATGLTWISKTGFTKLGIRISRDGDNSEPTGVNNMVLSAFEETGTSQDPKLVINYTIATTTSTTTSTSTTSTSSSTTKTDTTTTTSTTTTSSSTSSTSTSSTSSSTSSTSSSTSSTSSSTSSTSSSTTMPFSLAVDNV